MPKMEQIEVELGEEQSGKGTFLIKQDGIVDADVEVFIRVHPQQTPLLIKWMCDACEELGSPVNLLAIDKELKCLPGCEDD